MFFCILTAAVPQIILSKTGAVEFMKDLKPVNVTIGQSVTAIRGVVLTLLCPVEGFPLPKVSWRTTLRLITLLDEQKGYQIRMHNETVGTLVLNGTKVKSGLKVTYVCVASNIVASTEAYSSVVLKGRDM